MNSPEPSSRRDGSPRAGVDGDAGSPGAGTAEQPGMTRPRRQSVPVREARRRADAAITAVRALRVLLLRRSGAVVAWAMRTVAGRRRVERVVRLAADTLVALLEAPKVRCCSAACMH